MLPADRLGRCRSLRGALLPPVRFLLPRFARIAVPPRPGHERGRGRPRQPSARSGRHLRRRRQRRLDAGRLARLRARRDPSRGLAARHRPVRTVGRLAVLVRRGPVGLPRGSPARVRPRAAAVLQLRALRRRAGASRRVSPLRRRWHASRFRRRRRRGFALSRHPARAGRQRPRGRLRLPRRAGRQVGDGVPARGEPAGRRLGACAVRRRRGPQHGRLRLASASAWLRERLGGTPRPAHDLRDGWRRLHDGAAKSAAR